MHSEQEPPGCHFVHLPLGNTEVRRAEGQSAPAPFYISLGDPHTFLSPVLYPTRVPRRFLEIEVRGAEARVVAEHRELYEFSTPADFYIPTPAASAAYYGAVHELLAGDVEALAGRAATELLTEHGPAGFPEIGLPYMTVNGHCEDVEYSGAGAAAPREDRAVGAWLDGLFAGSPILKIAQIERRWREAGRFCLTEVKASLNRHATFYTGGPWRSCWVRIGYDPREDRGNYMYQSLFVRGVGVIQICEHPAILAEVEKKREWFLLAEYSPRDGFVSAGLRKLCEYFLLGGAPDR